jgi:hypothetical protein
MPDDAKHGSPGTMRFQSAQAKIANWPMAIRRAGNIDFADHAAAHPARSLARRNAAHLSDLSDKFMPQRAAKIMIATQNLNVGIANSSQPHADKRPPRP